MMEAKLSFVVVAFCFVACAVAAPKSIGDFVPPCSLKDPNLGECVLKKSKEFLTKIVPGVKEWGIPNLDPLFVIEMVLQETGNSAVNLDLSGRNLTFHGYKDTQIESVTMDPKSLHCEIMLLVPNLSGSGQYKMKGKILLLPISGEGPCNFAQEQQHVKLEIDFKTVEKKGKKYMKIDKMKHNILSTTKVVTHFDNLFNDKVLSDNMNKIMEENGQAVFAELKGRIENSLAELWLALLGPMFDRVPMNEIFTDTE